MKTSSPRRKLRTINRTALPKVAPWSPEKSLRMQTLTTTTARSARAPARRRLAARCAAVVFELDSEGRRRAKYEPEGWLFRTWAHEGRELRTHYSRTGQGPPVVLVHGFGASSYHWRYQIASLAEHHTVYAVCLVGYGLSEKANVAYSIPFWASQVSDFLQNVVQEPCFLAGNSIGAVTALAAAEAVPKLTRGVMLLNAAGRFADPDTSPAQQQPDSPNPLADLFRRVVATAIFYSTRFRIASILGSVYVNKGQLDEALVESISAPARDPAALEAFIQISSSGSRSPTTLNAYLSSLRDAGIPLCVIQGQADPWMTPSKGQKLVALYPGATSINLNAGHCPHDDAPEECSHAMLGWMAGVLSS